jgi:hypothetical protein
MLENKSRNRGRRSEIQSAEIAETEEMRDENNVESSQEDKRRNGAGAKQTALRGLSLSSLKTHPLNHHSFIHSFIHSFTT